MLRCLREVRIAGRFNAADSTGCHEINGIEKRSLTEPVGAIQYGDISPKSEGLRLAIGPKIFDCDAFESDGFRAPVRLHNWRVDDGSQFLRRAKFTGDTVLNNSFGTTFMLDNNIFS
jgi:hypothetical protein